MQIASIPLKKRSPRVQRAYHAAQCGDWNGVNPVTRVVKKQENI